MQRKEKDMRLAAQAKMGYYPTPDSVTGLILNHLKRMHEGVIRAFDPCAGQGTAIQMVGSHLKAKTYGIEIDIERGRQAKNILTKCLVTDYKNTKIGRGVFSLLYLNPPYDWTARSSDIERAERYEQTFLRDCIPYLCQGGILIYLIPLKRLDGHIAQMLSYRFDRVSVYRFPKEEFKAFKQLVIFGVLKKRPQKDDPLAQYLKNCGQLMSVIPYLPENPSRIYKVPASPTKANFVFRSKHIDPCELAEEIHQYGLFAQFKEMTTPLRMTEKIRPIMPLRHGHLAQILACGLINGIVWDNDKRNPLLVKGVTKKEVKHTVEIQGNIEKHIETAQIKVLIHAFNRHGEMLTIQ